MSQNPLYIKRLTVDQIRTLGMFDLLRHFDALMEPYQVRENETQDETRDRVSRTIDQGPDVYAWFGRIHAIFDWLTDRTKELEGAGSALYKEARQRRDAAEAARSDIKMRYQGASRLVTLWTGIEEEARMPKRR